MKGINHLLKYDHRVLRTESKARGHRYDGAFADALREYAWQHFNGRDLEKPCLVEHYHAVTGEPLSDEPDYNHSFFIDLIVRHVAGITYTTDGFTFDPIPVGCESFALENLPWQDHRLDVYFRAEGAEGDAPEDRRKGYTLVVDGVTVWQTETGAAYEYKLPSPREPRCRRAGIDGNAEETP